jgi:hypothetical protein
MPKWNEHIDQMEGNRLVRKVRDWLPNEMSNLGRSKMRCKDTKTEWMQQATKLNAERKKKKKYAHVISDSL